MSKLPKFSSRAFLAPLAGITDPAFRLLCREAGAGLVVTEMKSIHALVAKKKEIERFVGFSKRERPVAVQLFGSEIGVLKKAVEIVSPHFDIIDYNLGCPASQINEQKAGAVLLKEPELAREIFRALVGSTCKPASLKIRTGITKPDCFLKIARIAEEEGIKMITLHARTLKQGYSGKADWSKIKELREAVKIPVVGNGDIKTPEDAKRMLEETGCDYVMVGRAACGNPDLFTQINQYLKIGKYKDITTEERIKSFFRYLEYSKKWKIKFAHIRMQAMHFTRGIEGGKELREKVGKAEDMGELLRILESKSKFEL